MPTTCRRHLVPVLLAAVLVGACTGDPAPPASGDPDGTSLVIAVAEEPAELNPLAGYAETARRRSSRDWSSTTRTPRCAPRSPSSCRSPSPDGRTWTVKLRPDVTFTDGTPFEAEDVVATYRAMLDPARRSPVRGNGSRCSRPSAAVDPATVEFTLTAPYAPFPDLLVLGILPSESLAGTEPEPVGTGPYRLRTGGTARGWCSRRTRTTGTARRRSRRSRSSSSRTTTPARRGCARASSTAPRCRPRWPRSSTTPTACGCLAQRRRRARRRAARRQPGHRRPGRAARAQPRDRTASSMVDDVLAGQGSVALHADAGRARRVRRAGRDLRLRHHPRARPARLERLGHRADGIRAQGQDRLPGSRCATRPATRSPPGWPQAFATDARVGRRAGRPRSR